MQVWTPSTIHICLVAFCQSTTIVFAFFSNQSLNSASFNSRPSARPTGQGTAFPISRCICAIWYQHRLVLCSLSDNSLSSRPCPWWYRTGSDLGIPVTLQAHGQSGHACTANTGLSTVDSSLCIDLTHPWIQDPGLLCCWLNICDSGMEPLILIKTAIEICVYTQVVSALSLVMFITHTVFEPPSCNCRVWICHLPLFHGERLRNWRIEEIYCRRVLWVPLSCGYLTNLPLKFAPGRSLM